MLGLAVINDGKICSILSSEIEPPYLEGNGFPGTAGFHKPLTTTARHLL
jgi:hypothetical protein